MTEFTDVNSARNDGSIVIIGAGIAGLVCANLLVGASQRVIVLESAAEAGGRARTSITDGFRRNLGPHALYKEGALSGVLEALDIDVSGGEPEGPYFGLKGAELQRLPLGPWSLLASGLLGVASKVAFARLLRAMRAVEPATEDRAASAWLDDHVERRDVREVVEAFGRLATYCADFERMPAEVMLQQLQMAVSGVIYPDGGWQSIVDGLVGRFQKRGGLLHTGMPASGVVRRDDGLFDVCRRGDEPLEADRVVCAVPPVRTRSLLGERLAQAADVDFEPAPVEASCLDLAVDELPCPDRSLALGLEDPIYISDHGRFADLAPEGATVLHAARYLAAGDATDAEENRRAIEAALDGFQPGWRAGLHDARFLPRISVVSHLPSAESGGLASRPSPTPDRVDGLYLAGDWVGPTGWLSDASAASARRVARQILERQGEQRANRPPVGPLREHTGS